MPQQWLQSKVCEDVGDTEGPEKVPKGCCWLCQGASCYSKHDQCGVLLHLSLPVSLASSLKSLVTLSFSVTAELERKIPHTLSVECFIVHDQEKTEPY